MTDLILFFIIFGLLLAIALAFVFKPLISLSPNFRLGVCGFFAVGAIGFYLLWGDYFGWQRYRLGLTERQLMYRLDMAIAEQKLPELRTELTQLLDERPREAAVWLVLVRANIHLGEFDHAQDLLKIAYEQFGELPDFLLEDVQVELMSAHDDFSPRLKTLIDKLTHIAPEEPLVLNLQALLAAQQKKWQKALRLWQSALARLEPNSEEAVAIAQAIEAAKKQLATE